MLKKWYLICLILLPGLLFAQLMPPDTSIQLSTVTISSSRIELSSVGLIRQTIDSLQKEENPGSDLGQLIANSSSVEVRTYGMGFLSTLSVRGTSSNHTGLLWNGIRISPPNIGYIDLSLVQSGFFQNIDLIYGGEGPLYGSGFIGGSLHLNNKPSFGYPKQQISLEGSGGSFGTKIVGAEATFSGEKLYSSTSLTYRKSFNNYEFTNLNGQKEHMPHSTISGMGILQDLSFKISGNQYLTGSFWYQSAERDIPPTITEKQSQAHQSDRDIRSMISWKYLKSYGSFDAKLAWFDEYFHYSDTLHQVNSVIHTKTFNAVSESNIHLLKSSRIYAGVNYTNDFADLLAYQGSKSENVLALYASWLQEFRKIGWKASLNLRKEFLSNYNSPLIFSLGAEGHLWSCISSKVSFSRNFRAPTMNERYWLPGGNPGLNPEKSWNQEMSLIFNPDWTHFHLNIRGTIYNSTVEDWILWLPESNYWTVRNVGKVWARGFELFANQDFIISSLHFNLEQSYSYSRSTNEKKLFDLDGSYGKQLLYVPLNKILIRAAVEYRGYRFSLRENYSGKVFTSSDNANWIPGYNLLDIIIAKKILLSKQFNTNLQLNINNIFNIKYQVVPYRPMPGLNFLFTLKITFKSKTHEKN